MLLRLGVAYSYLKGITLPALLAVSAAGKVKDTAENFIEHSQKDRSDIGQITDKGNHVSTGSIHNSYYQLWYDIYQYTDAEKVLCEKIRIREKWFIGYYRIIWEHIRIVGSTAFERPVVSVQDVFRDMGSLEIQKFRNFVESGGTREGTTWASLMN